MPADQLVSRLAKGKPIPALLLLGDEPYLRDACRAQLIEAYVPETARDWGVSRYSAAEGELDAALARSQTMAMLCPTQVVFLAEVDAVERMPEAGRDRALDALSEYLDDPAPFTVLVLEADALDQRMKPAKLLFEKTLTVEVGLGEDAVVRQGTAAKMAKSMAKELGCEFAPGAAEDLAELVNAGLTRMKSEIDKLATRAGLKGKISREDIAALVVSSKRYTVWQLADMLAAQKQKSALEFLDALLREGEEPAALVGALAWMYRKLIEASELPPSAAGWQAARSLGMRPEAAEIAVRSARRIPKARLLEGLSTMYEADSLLKSGVKNPGAVMEFVVTRLAGSAGAGRVRP
jgi:DNA polymerase-3 subunit delta